MIYVNEGKQAEEYKARKAKEKTDREKAERERNERRYGDTHYLGSRWSQNPTWEKNLKSDNDDDFDKADRLRCKDEVRKDWSSNYANKHSRKASDVKIAADKANKRFRDKPSEYKKYIKSNYSDPDSFFAKRAIKMAGLKESYGIFESVEMI